MDVRLLAFVGVATILTITPGPDLALVTKVVFARGRNAGWWTSLGVVTGHLTWGALAGIGVAAILSASASLFTVLRLAGAAYLLWLGLHAFFARVSADEPQQAEQVPTPTTGASHRWRAYRQGLINDLLNPKIGVFYTTLLPQFIARGQPVLLMSVLLAAIFASIVALWLGTYVALLDRAGRFFQRPKVRQTLERVTGIVLVGLGIRLALERSGPLP